MPEDEPTSPNGYVTHPSDHADEERSAREVRVGIYATQQQADEVKERIARLLCPDPEHPPPCPVPWSASVVHESDLDDPEFYPELTEQGEAERELREQVGF